MTRVKDDLQRAFNELGIAVKAKAKDLEVIFEVKSCKVTFEGKRVHGYRIIGYK